MTNKKYLFSLAMVCTLLEVGFSSEKVQYGVFFCTRDLSPELVERLDQAKVGAAISSAVLSSSIAFSTGSIPLKIISSTSAVSSSALSVYYGTEAYEKWKEGLYRGLREMVNPVSGSSNINNNYINVKDDILKGNVYRHCSIVSAGYKATNDKEKIFLKGYETKGFYQDDDEGKTFSSNRNAVVQDDILYDSTVCTLVKKIDGKSDYIKAKLDIEKYFEDQADKGYTMFGNNCCTVAYNAVNTIGGKTEVIDKSSFNHGIGMPKGYFSFFVNTIEENKSTASEKDDTKKPDL